MFFGFLIGRGPLVLTARPQIGPERFRAPEILFDPEIIGLEYSGVHQMVVDAITRTDLDLRKALYSNIVLSGGTTLTKGFGDRLLHEVQKLAVKDMRIKIFAPPERKYSTWIGGSILAGLSTFRKASCFPGPFPFPLGSSLPLCRPRRRARGSCVAPQKVYHR